MKRVVLGILCFFTVGAFAQDLPRVETYVGYSFTRVNSAINVPAFSANGGLGEVAFNLSHWLGVVGSFNAVHNGNIHNLHVDQTAFGYMFGPRVNLRFGRSRRSVKRCSVRPMTRAASPYLAPRSR